MPRRLLPSFPFRGRLFRGLQGQTKTSCFSNPPRLATFHTTPHRRGQDCWVLPAKPDILHFRPSGDSTVTFSAAWLRDNCPQSRSPSSGNKSFATAEIPLNIQFESVRQNSDGNWVIQWRNDIPRFAEQGHVSVFTRQQLQALGAMSSPSPGLLVRPTSLQLQQDVVSPLLWDNNILRNRGLREIDYKDWMQGGDEFHRGVVELALTGLVFIKNVPQTEQAVSELGLKFGALQETFYGRTWDVVSKPQAENVAYTSEYLGLHSDMLYLRSPPKLQFLHCLENGATGGESLFSDAWRAAHELVTFRPSLAYPLAKYKIGFHYNANGFTYTQNRPVLGFESKIVTLSRQRFDRTDASNRPLGDLNDVWWSPPFQMPFALPVTRQARQRFHHWHTAAAAFQELLESDHSMLRRRLRPGECVVFDNSRVLHGRTAFDPASGPRHLRGAYVHLDDWKSTFNRVPAGMIDQVRELPGPAPRTREQLGEYIEARMGGKRLSENWEPPKKPTESQSG